MTSTTAEPGAPAGAPALGGGAACARAAASDRALTAARSTAPAIAAAIWACWAAARGSGRVMRPLYPNGTTPGPYAQVTHTDQVSCTALTWASTPRVDTEPGQDAGAVLTASTASRTCPLPTWSEPAATPPGT